MNKALTVVLGLLLFAGILIPPSFGGTFEEVYVEKVLEDGITAIVVRPGGRIYTLERGFGCHTLWRFERRTVLIVSSDVYDDGSFIVIPESREQCRIHDTQYVGRFVPPY